MSVDLKDISSEKEIDTLRKRAFYLEVISSFATKLLQARTIDEVVWTVAKHAVAKLGYVDCVVYLLDEDAGVLYQRAAHGPKNPVEFDINNPIIIPVGKGIVGSVAQSGIGEIINDTHNDRRYLLDDEARLSEITIPIITRDSVIGVIDSEHPERDFYTEDDFEVLTTIASMTSAKLEEIRIHEELMEHKTMLEDIVLDKTRELQSTVLKLQQSNFEISARNREKEVLIKEIHHRVKNNLQILSSLMNLQASVSTNDRERQVFWDCRNRILSMSAIHDQIYATGNMTEIKARQYMSEITDDLLRTFGASERVKLTFNVEDVLFDLDTSIPLGLVLNELIVNALKHGIKNEPGELSVTLHKEHRSVVLEVCDSGDGFDLEKIEGSTLGMELINTLTEQLAGTLEYTFGTPGTNCKLTFPIY